jgi:hypothetical protein
VDTLNNMVAKYGPAIVNKVLMLQGLWFVQHGVFSQNYVEVYVSVGTAAVGAAWSFWNTYGRDIVTSELDMWKAQALAQAAKMREHNVAPVTVGQIAAQSPTMDVAAVTKVIATLPAEAQANIAPAAPSPLIPPKVVALIAALILGASMWPGDVSAQVRTRPTERTIPAAAPAPATSAVAEASGGALPTLTAWAPKPHLLKLLNPLGWPDPMCITDHPSSTCPTGTTTVDGKIVGGVQMTGNPQTDFTNFVQRGGITFVRDMKRADQFLLYPCTSTSAPGCVKTDVLSSSCLEAIIPIAMLIVNGPPSNATTTDSSTTTAPITAPVSSATPVAGTAPATAPLTLDGLPAVAAANGTTMSTDKPTITSADDGVVTAAAKLDVVYLAVQGPALKQGCGGWVQNQVTQFGSFAAGLMTFVTGLGLSGAGAGVL